MKLRPGYFNVLQTRLLGLIDHVHLVSGRADAHALLIAVAIGSLALFLGLLISTQLIAASGTGKAGGIALCMVALALGADAIRFQLEPLPVWGAPLLAAVAFAALVRICRDLLDASAAKTVGALVVGAFFGSLIAVLLGLGVQIGNSI